MKRRSLIGLLTVTFGFAGMSVLTGTAWASHGVPRHAQDSQEETKQALTTLLKDFAKASIRGDAAFFDRVLSDDYVVTTTTGEVKNKAQVLRDYTSHDIKFTRHVFDDIQVKLYGDTAVVTNRANAVSSFRGKPRNGLTRNTRVFVKHGDRWQCVAFQSTTIARSKAQ